MIHTVATEPDRIMLLLLEPMDVDQKLLKLLHCRKAETSDEGVLTTIEPIEAERG